MGKIAKEAEEVAVADNYLEKRYAELQQGIPVLKRNTPSLDSLLKKIASPVPDPGSYIVLQAQLDALVRSASILFPSCAFKTAQTTDAGPACIIIVSEDLSDCQLGEISVVIRLKAAELGLCSHFDISQRKVELFR